ncbi:MAG: alpha-glucan family phosphorylase [Elusimicrobiota bacterium]
MNVTPFDVLPRLPEKLEPLRAIAFNLCYVWNWEAVRLFIRMDPDFWDKTYQNPALMLSRLPQRKFDELAADEGFIANMRRVNEQLRSYMEAPTWFHRSHPDLGGHVFAYFSCEFGIDVSMPIYSGGLGALAGDHLKSASDLGLPMVAVGLLYREGYHSQYLTADGWQQEAYPINDWYNMPVVRACDREGRAVRARVELAGREVAFEVWRVQVGRVPLFLLDTDLPDNPSEDRDITKRLYVGDRDMRLRQEVLLGIGGMRALAALGYEPSVCHMNEGHSAFLAVERVRQIMEKYKLSREEAREVLRASTVFTTHTPVPAGNERFSAESVRTYLGRHAEGIGMSVSEFLDLGRDKPGEKDEEFCMTTFAMRFAAHLNGVSRLHGEVSQKMWSHLWPGLPIEEVPIGAVTNGIHTHSWLSHDLAELLGRYFGPKFHEDPMDFSVWKRVYEIPDSELWRSRETRRDRLVWFARKRLKKQLIRRGASSHLLQQAEQMLDPDALTIGFARRFAAYKRATLLLQDPARLRAILNDPKRPVQVIVAGKAHPNDTAGKELIKELVHFIRQEGFRNRIVFIEDYDINVARYMVQGADVWLNTPRRPLEASGTSGMKAAANGGLHLSTYDGWWCEGYDPEVGWALGSGGEVYDTPENEDKVESSTLYDILENEVVPLFYDRGKDGLPHRWIARVKRSMAEIGAQFNTHRMVADYVDRYYVRAGRKFGELTAGGQERAKDLAAWHGHIRKHWGEIRVEDVRSDARGTLGVGDSLEVSARVRLGGLRPEDVEIQLYFGHLSSPGQLAGGRGLRMEPDPPEGEVFTYRGRIPCETSGRCGYTVRVLPRHPDLMHPYEPGLILWA